MGLVGKFDIKLEVIMLLIKCLFFCIEVVVVCGFLLFLKGGNMFFVIGEIGEEVEGGCFLCFLVVRLVVVLVWEFLCEGLFDLLLGDRFWYEFLLLEYDLGICCFFFIFFVIKFFNSFNFDGFLMFLKFFLFLFFLEIMDNFDE